MTVPSFPLADTTEILARAFLKIKNRVGSVSLGKESLFRRQVHNSTSKAGAGEKGTYVKWYVTRLNHSMAPSKPAFGCGRPESDGFNMSP